MDTNNKRKRGGQFKLSLEEKKEIVDSYFQLNAGGDPQKLRAHNVFAQLAKYANTLDWKAADGREIKPKDFSSSEIREYINELAVAAEQISNENAYCLSVYTPLDFITLTTKSYDDVIQIVKTRESAYESVCKCAGRLSLKCAELQKQVNQKDNLLLDKDKELAVANNRILDLQYELDVLKFQYKRLQKAAKGAESQVMQEHYDKIVQIDSNNRGSEYTRILTKKIGECQQKDTFADEEEDDFNGIDEWDYNG